MFGGSCSGRASSFAHVPSHTGLHDLPPNNVLPSPGVGTIPTHLKAPPNHYDAAWKLVIEHLFRPFLAMLFPPVAAQVDWSRKPRFLDGQLQAILPEPGRFSLKTAVGAGISHPPVEPKARPVP